MKSGEIGKKTSDSDKIQLKQKKKKMYIYKIKEAGKMQVNL